MSLSRAIGLQQRSSLFFNEEHDLIQIAVHHLSKKPSHISLQKLKHGALTPIELCSLEKITALKQILDEDIENKKIVDPDYLMTICGTQGVFQNAKPSGCCLIL